MIKLRTFIPEIKIVPNNREPQVGERYHYNNGHGWKEDVEIIEDVQWSDVPKYRLLVLDNPDYKFYEDKTDFIKGIKNKLTTKIKSDIKEIKIVPNTKYKVGDHFTHSPNLMINGVKASKGDTMIITDIKDGKVYYDTIDGYWADMDSVNYRTKEEFNKIINKGDWVIIKDIQEIKIVPNTIRDNEGLLKYFIRNKAEILDAILSTTKQEFYRKNHLYLSFRWMDQEPFISTIKYVGAVELTDKQHIQYLYLSLQPLKDGHFGNTMTQNIKYKGITIYYSY